MMDYCLRHSLWCTYQTLLITCCSLCFTPLAVSDLSDMFVSEQVSEQFLARFQAQAKEQQKAMVEFWPPINGEQAKLWVTYSDNYLIRQVVDFQREQVRISYQGKALLDSTPETLQQDVERLVSLDLVGAYNMDSLLVSLMAAPEANYPLLNLTQSQIKGLYLGADYQRSKGLQGDVLTITVDLPNDSLHQRADKIQPAVEQLAEEADVSSALVMALIHQQSAFNLLANTSQSSIGLMLVNSNQAGEVSSDLYNPERNIAFGVEYLALLDEQFSAIEDDESRQLCVIAAYRVGVNEVVRAFTGRTSLSQAAPLINQLSARQIKGQFRSQLEKLNGGSYVQEVSSLLALYE